MSQDVLYVLLQVAEDVRWRLVDRLVAFLAWQGVPCRSLDLRSHTSFADILAAVRQAPQQQLPAQLPLKQTASACALAASPMCFLHISPTLVPDATALAGLSPLFVRCRQRHDEFLAPLPPGVCAIDVTVQEGLSLWRFPRDRPSLQPMVSFCLAARPSSRLLFLTRHGQSEDNATSRLGGDSLLTEKGRAYAHGLRAYFQSHPVPRLSVWCSALQRATESAKIILLGTATQPRVHPGLNEIRSGKFEGHTYESMAAADPVAFVARGADKLRYRYPGGGESYEDLITRVQPVILELERADQPVLLISHQATLRALYGFCIGTPRSAIPTLDIPAETLIRLEYVDGNFVGETRIPMKELARL